MSVILPPPLSFGTELRHFDCESLNINSVLNNRSNGHALRELCVMSVCGGKSDDFTKTVLEWLHRSKFLSSIHFLLCGPSKCIDSQLAAIADKIGNENVATTLSEKRKFGPKMYLKRQTNLPTTAQWQILKPQIVLIGLHYLSERWCAKNFSNEILFPKRSGLDNTELSNYESCYQSGQSDSDEDEPADDSSSGEEADVETSDDAPVSSRKRKQRLKPLLVVEKSQRPTLYRTEVYRKAMFIECLAQVAKYRPKIVFVQNILEPSKQAERRRKDQVSWEILLDIAHGFCNEASYHLRPVGLEMKEEKESEEFPSKDIWCNGMFFERIDNGFMNVSHLYHEFALYNSSENMQRITAAIEWIFYDQTESSSTEMSHRKLLEQFAVDSMELFGNAIVKTLKKKKRTKLQTRKSVTIPVQICFPAAFAKALAYYSIAQVIATSID